jgi:hypothetical protein
MWKHADPDLAPFADAALDRALSGDWSGPLKTCTRELRAYWVLSVYHQARLGGTVTTGTASDGAWVSCLPGPAGDAERDEVRLALEATLGYFADRIGAGAVDPSTEDVSTTKGQSLAEVGETAALPAAAVVAVVALASVAVGYLGYRTSIVVDRELQRSAAARQLLQADAAVQKLVSEHLQREDEAGKALPLSDATQKALDALRGRQRELSIEPPKPGGAGGLEWPLLVAGGLLVVAAAVFTRR